MMEQLVLLMVASHYKQEAEQWKREAIESLRLAWRSTTDAVRAVEVAEKNKALMEEWRKTATEAMGGVYVH